MRPMKAWTLASKDFLTFKKKKSLIYSLIGFQVFVSIGLPLIVRYAGARHRAIPNAVRPVLLNSFSFWFAMGAAFIRMGIASYSLIGEKINKSLNPCSLPRSPMKSYCWEKASSPLCLP